MRDLDLCGRCLVILNVTTSVRDMVTKDECETPTDPYKLRAWVEDRLYGLRHAVSVDDRPDAFDAVTTWHGDPVCWSHLAECRQRELRSRA